MPEPRRDETRDDFIDRFMGSAEARRDFPDQAVRFRVAVSEWERRATKQVGRVMEDPYRQSMRKRGDLTSLYVHRLVKNEAEVRRWAKSVGFTMDKIEDNLHVTIAFSINPVDWFQFDPSPREEVVIPAGGPRSLARFGPEDNAVVLRFRSPLLEHRWQEFRDGGASWEHGSFKPHVTISLDEPNLDVETAEPFQGRLVLGPEVFSEAGLPDVAEKRGFATGGFVDVDSFRKALMSKNGPPLDVVLQSNHLSMGMTGRIIKADREHRVIYGWFSPVEKDGQVIIDSQDDVIDEDQILETAHKFLLESRAVKVMHRGRRLGDVVESIVFTKDLQRALGIDLGMVGWFGGTKVRDDETWARAKAGEFSGFSVAGLGKRTVI